MEIKKLSRKISGCSKNHRKTKIYPVKNYVKQIQQDIQNKSRKNLRLYQTPLDIKNMSRNIFVYIRHSKYVRKNSGYIERRWSFKIGPQYFTTDVLSKCSVKSSFIWNTTGRSKHVRPILISYRVV